MVTFLLSCKITWKNIRSTITMLYPNLCYNNYPVLLIRRRRCTQLIFSQVLLTVFTDHLLCNSYTIGCPPVRGDSPRALAR